MTFEDKTRQILTMAMDTSPEGMIIRELCNNEKVPITDLLDTITKHMPETILKIEEAWNND